MSKTFVSRLCAALCLAGEELTQPISEAQFGDLFAHADRLVQYMRDHPIITDAALLILQSLRHLNIGEDVDREPPGYIGFLNRYSLPCLQFAWQNHRAADLPDPMRDYRGEGREQDGDGPTVEFLGRCGRPASLQLGRRPGRKVPELVWTRSTSHPLCRFRSQSSCFISWTRFRSHSANPVLLHSSKEA